MEQAFTQNSPFEVFRSKMFSLKTLTYFACDAQYTLTHTWKSIKLDTNETLDLTIYSTYQSAELVIWKNTLEYGLYKFEFEVNISIMNNNSTFLTSRADTFVKIIPTGLEINVVQDGLSSVLIGSQQTLTLDPTKYSIDLDNLIDLTALTFRFYCYPISLKASFYINKTNKSNDLFSFKNDSVPGSSCFESNSAFSFDSTRNILTLNQGSLKYFENITYLFEIETDFMNQTFSQIINIQVDSTALNVPLANLRYYFRFRKIRF